MYPATTLESSKGDNYPRTEGFEQQGQLNRHTVTSSKKWYLAGAAVTLIFLGISVFGSLGVSSLLGASLPGGLDAVFNTISHTFSEGSLWSMALGGVTAATILAIIGIYNLKQEKSTVDQEQEKSTVDQEQEIAGNDVENLEQDRPEEEEALAFLQDLFKNEEKFPNEEIASKFAEGLPEQGTYRISNPSNPSNLHRLTLRLFNSGQLITCTFTSDKYQETKNALGILGYADIEEVDESEGLQASDEEVDKEAYYQSLSPEQKAAVDFFAGLPYQTLPEFDLATLERVIPEGTYSIRDLRSSYGLLVRDKGWHYHHFLNREEIEHARQHLKVVGYADSFGFQKLEAEEYIKENSRPLFEHEKTPSGMSPGTYFILDLVEEESSKVVSTLYVWLEGETKVRVVDLVSSVEEKMHEHLKTLGARQFKREQYKMPS